MPQVACRPTRKATIGKVPASPAAGRRGRSAGAGALVEHAAGAEGGLGQAGQRAPLPDKGSLLVAGDAADWRRACQGVGVADEARGVDDARQHRAWDAQPLEQWLVPVHGGRVHQGGDGGVGGVGDVQGLAAVGRAARDDPGHPGVDRAEAQLAPLGPGALGVDLVEDRHQLGGRGVGGDPDALGLEGETGSNGAQVLPADTGGERCPGAPLPHDGRGALVGDAHTVDGTALGQRGPGDGQDGARP